jgi:hypothetical protein
MSGYKVGYGKPPKTRQFKKGNYQSPLTSGTTSP